MYLLACMDDTAPTNASCANQVWLSYSDLASYQMDSFDPSVAAQMFGSGVALVLTFFMVGYCAGSVLKAIRRS
ncbi:hypothetical protein [Salinisphaera sp.]|uniref:hypothetical protein n=1 Tax=Salinisphaera sp. TaxID=1914330 RepID=UPI000C63F6BD|nr:hypothetical protein [Salinisphaera sp.]MAS10528.1 hypothetical protein [Salinisphaera sp.]|tara:strand:- start:294 stop:512 length:219 start_codon:yes stop_codon:yes gene_type:complete